MTDNRDGVFTRNPLTRTLHIEHTFNSILNATCHRVNFKEKEKNGEK